MLWQILCHSKRLRVLPDAEFFSLVAGQGATLWINRFSCLSGDASEIRC